MFPTDAIKPHARGGAEHASRVVRIGAACLTLGLSTAFASELTITPSMPERIDPQDASGSTWSYFDPGFLVDHLPFRLTVGQTVSYSDNVFNLPENVPLVVGTNQVTRLRSRGDFFSDTTINIASRFPQGAQTYFFNGTYAPRRYFTDTALNAENYSINGGVDFTFGSRCSGRLVGGANQYQVALDQSVGAGVQESSSTSFNETARCKISSTMAATLNSGISRIENAGTQLGINSALNFGLNNYDQQYVSVGLEYAPSSIDTFSGTVTFSNRDFPDRPAGLPLAQNTTQQDYQFSYLRVFSAKLDGSLSTGFSIFSFPGAADTSTQPTYGVQLNYRPTPKIVASGSVSRSAGAPQNAISNFQVSNTQSLSVSYLYSPKLSFSGVVSHSTIDNPGVNNALATSVLFGNFETKNASIIASYRATPLITATAAYSYVNRTDTSRSGFDAVSNVFRVGLVYTR